MLKKLPKLGTKLRQEIKLEPISETSSTSTNSKTKSETKENDLNSINIKREKISLGVRDVENTSADSSILVIPNEVNIITLSDDDDDENENDDNKMPPPMMPAPKKLPARKTRNNTNKNNASSESVTSEATSTETTEAQLQPKKTKKGKKSKKPVLPIVEIKQEKVAEEVAMPSEGTSKDQTVTKSSSDISSKNVTLESVYEDASDKVQSVSHSQQTSFSS